MNDKVRTINIEGIEVQTSLTPLELASLPQKYVELQFNWNSLREWLEKNWKDSQDIWYVKIINKMNELEGKDNNERKFKERY